MTLWELMQEKEEKLGMFGERMLRNEKCTEICGHFVICHFRDELMGGEEKHQGFEIHNQIF